MGIWDRTFRDQDGVRIPGAVLLAFIHNGQFHYLAQIKVYADGMVDAWGLETFQRFTQKVDEGWVVTALPEGAEVSIGPLARFRAKGVVSGVAEAELVKEVADLIEALNDRPTSSKRCFEAFDEYQRSPSPAAKQRLRRAYEAVPEHLRIFVLGDQDRKDFPIRQVLYGRSRAAQAPKPVTPALHHAQLEGSLMMAVSSLYQDSGVGAPVFPHEVLGEVIALFREQGAAAGCRRLVRDARATAKKCRRRPMVLARVAASLASLGQHHELEGEPERAADLYFESFKLNPDGLAAIYLANNCVQREDRRRARLLARAMGAVGVDFGSTGIHQALGLELAAFETLLRR